MEFRLVYAGSLLKAAGYNKSRVWEKHQIRRYLHHQLERLWSTHPLLAFYAQPAHIQRDGFAGRVVKHVTIGSIAEHYEGFVPVVNTQFGMICELDILFLRAETAGNLLKHGTGGGDIDNRMKVLFDALRIPERGEVKLKEGDEPDPKPMFVLLSDDSLVTSVKITTDRLLISEGDDPAEACVVIHANVKGVDPMLTPYEVSV